MSQFQSILTQNMWSTDHLSYLSNLCFERLNSLYLYSKCPTSGAWRSPFFHKEDLWMMAFVHHFSEEIDLRTSCIFPFVWDPLNPISMDSLIYADNTWELSKVKSLPSYLPRIHWSKEFTNTQHQIWRPEDQSEASIMAKRCLGLEIKAFLWKKSWDL